MKRLSAFATSVTLAGILAAFIAMPAKADPMYCSGFEAGYKAAYCSKAVHMSSCNPQDIECDSLTAEGYATGYIAGQRAGLEAAPAKQSDDPAKSAKAATH